MSPETAALFAEIDADPTYDWADRLVDWLERHPTESVTASTAAKAISTADSHVTTAQARAALDILVRMGSVTDQAGRGGAWTRWALAR